MARRDVFTTKQKALQINLNDTIYGSIAETGAGQEVARHFFRVGGASGTIASTLSAYDKEISDAVYGKIASGRYVCKSRLEKMLQKEYSLLKERLKGEQNSYRRLFSFANTVATINYQKTFGGHGWLGVRFQLYPKGAVNEMIIHIRLHDNDSTLQQEAVGVIGVNLIYACFYYYDDPKEMLLSLYDDIDKDRVEVDMVQLAGINFEGVDNRLLSLQLVKNGMTDVVMFGPDGQNIHPSEGLYKKNILALRGSFRPVTKVNIDMIKTGFNTFIKEKKIEQNNVLLLFEITLNNLRASGDIDEQDFLDRADILCSLGQTVIISNYQKYYKLVEYFSQYTKARMGLIIGSDNFVEILDEKYYRNLNGGILEAFGIMLMRDLKIYLYPSQPSKGKEIITLKNIRVHPRVRPLLDYLIYNKRIIDIVDYNPEVLSIFSVEALKLIKEGKQGWEDMLPAYVDNIIIEKRLFGYNPEKHRKMKTSAHN